MAQTLSVVKYRDPDGNTYEFYDNAGAAEVRVNGTKVSGPRQSAIASAPAGGTGATAGAYDTAAHRDELIAAVNAILVALRAHGLIAT